MPSGTQLPRTIRFENYELDTCAGELRTDNQRIHLQGQPLQVLLLLLDRAADVVTREEFRSKLWPADTFVDFDDGLNHAVRKLREALGDRAEEPRFIETVPKRGHRFIAPVDGRAGLRGASGRPQGTPLQRHKLALGIAGVAVVVAAVVLTMNVAGLRGRFLRVIGARHGSTVPKIESIAVMPLQNLSGDPEQEYFADGLTDELITDLGKISSLRVISQTSVMRYKGTRKPLPEIARELNVDAVVEGTVERSGSRVRITADLLYAPTDQHLWAEVYESDLQDVLTLQDEVASAIASQIQTRLTPQERARFTHARPVNPEAHDAYLKGLYFWNLRTEQNLKKGIEYFQQAIEKDPAYALAYVGLADSYIVLGEHGAMASRDAFPRAKAASRKALELDETLGEAHTSLGAAKADYDWDWAGAEEEFKRGIALNPNYATGHHWYADYLSAMGRHKEAIAEIERAQELDPLSFMIDTAVGNLFFFARRYDEAAVQCAKRAWAEWGILRGALLPRPGVRETGAFPAIDLRVPDRNGS